MKKEYHIKSNLLYAKKQYITNFKEGIVLKVFYIARKRNKKRIYNIIGLCLSKNDNNFIIYNKLKKEKIQMMFTFYSPSVLKMFIIKMYKPFIFRVCKMYFKKNLFLKEDFYFSNIINSDINSYTFNFSIAFRKMPRAKKKKIRAKYRYKKIIDYKEYKLQAKEIKRQRFIDNNMSRLRLVDSERSVAYKNRYFNNLFYYTDDEYNNENEDNNFVNKQENLKLFDENLSENDEFLFIKLNTTCEKSVIKQIIFKKFYKKIIFKINNILL